MIGNKKQKKMALHCFSLFALMLIITGIPLFYPNRNLLISHGLFYPFLFILEFMIIVPLYFYRFKKLPGFGLGNFSFSQLIVYSIAILCIQLGYPFLLGQDKLIGMSNQPQLFPRYVYWLTQLTLIFMVPLYEEISFRGGLFSALQIWIKNPYFASCVTSITFSLLHTQYTDINSMVILFFISLILVSARRKTNGLLLPITLHMLMNSAAVLV
ncbi:CPBP family intramembrane metalloprotease [Rahnella sp. FC061912-K]|uniref:CPBP family intramembrane glutamic endopeptidase n=1 Tax=Rahnella rivi TaxID=2816249 RepID=UPI001C262884|nr:type II CAAX endopeptidase family protein [Rahnella rivi]MBU9828510.1 CPBP family intramembrane metalloprotease [Rahnella rivi]